MGLGLGLGVVGEKRGWSVVLGLGVVGEGRGWSVVILRARCVAVGLVRFVVGSVGGAAVGLLIGRRTVILVRAGLHVAAVVFRHM